MLYCRTCGQCGHIDDTNFYEIRYTSGWERNVVECWEGDYVDTDDSEINDSSHDRYNCPYCDGEDVRDDSYATEDEARVQREIYEAEMLKLRRKREIEKIKDESWDPVGNIQ
jgi:hypothetical protein